MTRLLPLTCLTLLMSVACSDGGADDSTTAENEAATEQTNAASGSADDSASGTQLTECDTDVPADGECDPMAACAAYDPDCEGQDIGGEPGELPVDPDAEAAAAGTQLTECDTDVPADGECDPMAACAAYDPDCEGQDIGGEPGELPVDPDAEAAAAGSGLAGGTQLTECDTDQPEDGLCDETAACAAYDPDCGYEQLDCEQDPPSDGECDLEDECWGYDPDCE